jgi:hypothetical protein
MSGKEVDGIQIHLTRLHRVSAFAKTASIGRRIRYSALVVGRFHLRRQARLSISTQLAASLSMLAINRRCTSSSSSQPAWTTPFST